MKIKSNAGYTLIELLIYIAIFAVVAGMLSGILATFVRIQGQESASAAVTQELSFVQTTIQRLVRESVNIENPAGAASSTLILRMASSTLDPTIISSDVNAIYLKQGNNATSTLTSTRVKVSQFQAVKYENPGGHAIAQIDLSLTYNSQRLYQQITRNLKISIGRVTAATFDDNLLPNQDNWWSLGLAPSNRWKYIYLSDGTATYPSYTFGFNTGLGLFRAGDNILGLSTAGTERMRIDASGNIGIGTTAPGGNLDIYKSQSGYTSLYIQNPNTGTAARSGIEMYGNKLALDIRTHGSAFNSYTHAGISMAGWAEIWADQLSASGVNGLLIGTGANSAPVAFAQNGAEVMRISGGNVGIGTTGPSTKLDVNGTVTANDLSLSTPSAVSVRTSATQSSGVASAFTKINFNSEISDKNNEFDTTNYRFTAKRAGIYLVHLKVTISDSQAGTLNEPLIYVNGAAARYAHNYPGANGYADYQVSAILELAVNDYVEGYMRCQSANRTINTDGNLATVMSIVKLY